MDQLIAKENEKIKKEIERMKIKLKELNIEKEEIMKEKVEKLENDFAIETEVYKKKRKSETSFENEMESFMKIFMNDEGTLQKLYMEYVEIKNKKIVVQEDLLKEE